MAFTGRDVDLLRFGEGAEEVELALRQGDHVELGDDHEDGRRVHVLHDAVRLPHDDLVVGLQRGPVLVAGRAARFGVHHVVEFLLVGADAHPRGILALFGEDGQEDGRVPCALGFAVAH